MNNNILLTKRFIETENIIRNRIKLTSNILEIGANDASFKHSLQQQDNKNWKTVDKYGEPDILSDIDGKEAKLPFENESIDLIICTEVLEHLTLGNYIIKEMARVIKNDGVAIISVPNIVSLKSRIKLLLGKLPNNAASGDCGHPLGGTGYLIDGDWVGGHIVDFNPARLFGYLQRGGLKVNKHIGLSTTIKILGKQLYIPSTFIPKNFSDYILVISNKK